jgi:hypothetical protein
MYLNILGVGRQRYYSLGYSGGKRAPGTQSFKEAFTNGNQEKSSQEKEEKVAE